MATLIQRLAPGATVPYRGTDATVFVCTEGAGQSQIGNETIPWGPRDLFVAPSWAPVIHDVAEEATLFSYSDRAVQEKLGLWRERRGNA